MPSEEKRVRTITYRSLGPLAAWGALVLAAGCTAPAPDLPREEAHAPSAQKTVRAAHHWDVMADDVAAHVADRLRLWPAGEHPIHVAVGPDASDFNLAFRQLLVTHLVERGVTVSSEPTAAAQLAVSTQIVQHRAGAPLTSSGARLSPQVVVVRNPAGYAPVPAAALVDAGPMRTEILVTTSLERDQRFLVRTSAVYTIAQDDAALYQARIPLPLPAPTPVKTWAVTP